MKFRELGVIRGLSGVGGVQDLGDFVGAESKAGIVTYLWQSA